MNITLIQAGMIGEEPVTECQMSSGRMVVSLLSYGAAIRQIRPYGRESANIILAFDRLEEYRDNPLYAGAVLGPNAGRISGGGPFTSPFRLSQNDGLHQLHGGVCGLSFRNWEITQTAESANACSVTLSCRIPHGVDGYPGSRRFTVCYTLTQDRTLSLRFHADTDRPTYINLSSHAYFHLGGDFSRPVLPHLLQIGASRYTVLRPDHIPDRIADCAGSPFDFSLPRSMDGQAKKYPRHPQLEIGHGYNHGFILDHPLSDPLAGSQTDPPCLTLTEPESGHWMNVWTDAPCAVVYTGGFIGGGHLLEGGVPSSNSCAAAIECQDIPDTPNLLPGQIRVTTPERPFDRTVIYQFGDSSTAPSHSIQ